jgi:hypothetical protein
MDEKERQASCPHPSFTQERISGMGTGDYYCDRCGKFRDGTEKPPERPKD